MMANPIPQPGLNDPRMIRGTMNELVQRLTWDVSRDFKDDESRTQPIPIYILRGSEKNDLNKKNIKKFFGKLSEWITLKGVTKQKLIFANNRIEDEHFESIMTVFKKSIDGPQRWEIDFSENRVKLAKKMGFFMQKTTPIESDREVYKKLQFLKINLADNPILDDPSTLKKIYTFLKDTDNIWINFSIRCNDSVKTMQLKSDINSCSEKHVLQEDLKTEMDQIKKLIDFIEDSDNMTAAYDELLKNLTASYSRFNETYKKLLKDHKNTFEALALESIKNGHYKITRKVKKAAKFLESKRPQELINLSDDRNCEASHYNMSNVLIPSSSDQSRSMERTH